MHGTTKLKDKNIFFSN